MCIRDRILSVCFLFSINTVSYAANISSRKASNPVIQSMNDKYHVEDVYKRQVSGTGKIPAKDRCGSDNQSKGFETIPISAVKAIS